MTRVTKKPLDPKVSKQLRAQLAQLFIFAGNAHTSQLLSAVLSPTEQIMIMKRVAIVLLLHKERSTYEISKKLLVSDQTVRVVKKEMKAGRYDPIITLVGKKDFDYEKFWNVLGKVLTLGMPGYTDNRAALMRKHIS